MAKIYILSKHSDNDLSDTIFNMSADSLRIALYGVARGWNFDDAITYALEADSGIKNIARNLDTVEYE